MLNSSANPSARPMTRTQRRLEERRRAKEARRAHAGPLRPKKVKELTDQLDATTGQQLTRDAHEITRTTYGARLLSPKHDNALFYIAARLTHMVTGHARQQFDTDAVRLAYGLQCGGGKTLSALSWMTAVHRLGLPYSVAMAANEVRGLIELRRQLIEDFGVPADKIGLLHRMGNTVSVPSTPDGELADKQFLLVTHNMVQTGAKNVALYNTYQDQPRDLVIYDESLVVSEAFSLRHRHIQSGLDYIAAEIKFPIHPGANDHLTVIRQYLEDTLQMFLDEVDAQQQDGKAPGAVMVPFLTDYAEDLYPDGAKRLLPSRCPRTVHALLDASGREVRPVVEAQRGVVWFTVKVPDELKNVFVLDASHLIRALPALGGNLIEDRNAVDPNITFPKLTIEYFQQPAGRGSITTECTLPVKQRSLAKKIATWINSKSEGERVNVWTFKARDARMDDNGLKKYPDVPAKLAESLEKFGVDMSRVTILTHGMAQGSNQFADAHHTAFYGVLEMDKLDLAASIVGQHRDLLASLDDLETVHKSEILHAAFQEIARSNVRKIVNGVGGRGTVLFPCWHVDVAERLDSQHAFRGATMAHRIDLEDAEKVRRDPAQYELVAESIVATLRDMDPDVRSIGTSKLRPTVEKRIGFEITEKIWKMAFANLQDLPLIGGATPPPGPINWKATKRGFRRFSADEYGFTSQ